MGFLFWLIVFVGIIWLIINQKNKQLNSQLFKERLKGQAEVRDYLTDWLSRQPATIKKKELLELMGINEPKRTATKTVSTTIPEDKATVILQDDLVDNVQKLEKNKEQREIQNVNTILYVASFLLVAAAVLFIGANVDNSIKFVGAWLVALGFYASGMILHTTSTRLRPAAIAFIGTGLALIPFAGIATNQFMLHDPKLSWLITSLFGIGLFLWASFRLQSQFLAYLTLGFVFSLTTSSVAVLQLGFIWYFVLVIIVTSLLNILVTLFPRLSGQLFSKPIDTTGQLAVPLAVFGSWITTAELPAWQHGMILLVTAIHYLISALRPYKISYRYPYIFAARVAAMGSLFAFTYDATHSWKSVGIAIFIAAILQIIISLLAIQSRKINNLSYEEAWLWIGLGLQLFSLLFVEQDVALRTTILATVTISGILVSALRQQSSYGYVSLFVIPLLVFQIGYEQFSPSLSSEVYSIIFMIFALACFRLRIKWKSSLQYSKLSMLGYAVYTTIMVLVVIGLSHQWIGAILLIAALFAGFASYIEKEKSITVLSAFLVYISAYQLSYLFNDSADATLRFIITAWIAGTALYIARIVLANLRDQDRSQICGVGSMAILGITSLFSIMTDLYAVNAAVMMIVVSLLFIIEARIYKQHEYNEIAVIGITFALQRLAATQLSHDLNFSVYVMWWVFIFYALAWVRRLRKEKSATRFWALGSIGLALLVGFSYLMIDTKVWDLVLLFGIAASILCIEAWKQKTYIFYEVAAIVATIALQRLIAVNFDINGLYYTHWWALIFALIAAGRRFIKQERETARMWWIGALITMSIPSGLVALGSGGNYQMLFLLEHTGLLIAASAFNNRLTILWGVAGVALAILYWLQSYSYVLVALLGLSLIGFAIWRLMRK